jgi:hypothetical protein
MGFCFWEGNVAGLLIRLARPLGGRFVVRVPGQRDFELGLAMAGDDPRSQSPLRVAPNSISTLDGRFSSAPTDFSNTATSSPSEESAF